LLYDCRADQSPFMINSKRTLKDLSFTGTDAGNNIMNLIDRCTTAAGRTVLQRQLLKSPASYEGLVRQQEVIRYWAAHPQHWSSLITNGTIVMLEKFYESADSYASHPGTAGFMSGKFFQKFFNRNEYHFTQFSLSHLSDFLKGCQDFVQLLDEAETLPGLLAATFLDMRTALDHRLTHDLVRIHKDTPFKEVAQLSFHARREMKANIHKLIDLYAQLDAWYGMASATNEHRWVFPELLPQQEVCLEAKGLHHPFLENAVQYDIAFCKGQNFMLLTGANMSGKTTLMRTLGVSAMLAHLGMGVPADALRISFLEGVITNMHVEDDLLKGESFFLAEVKSMKQTAEAVAYSGSQLVLMDELFKGTNVHDAYECTKAIVAGLLQHPRHIMILSTHLHEVAHHFEQHEGLSFYRFRTTLGTDGNFRFDYQLSEGISDERIGYKILVREGIVDILNGKI
jgi:DNA mismatch repair protein MutS